MFRSAVSVKSEMSKRSGHFFHRLTALITLWAFAFTTLAPSHGALSQPGARCVFTNYTYDEVGNLQSFATPNGVAHGYTYNALNRLTNLTVINGIGNIATYDYTQLRTGHRSSAHETFAGTLSNPQSTIRNPKYQYDALYRLRKETITANIGASGVADYALDAVGNRENRTSTVPGLSQQTFTHDANDRLDSDTYDANGNTKAGKITLNATGAEAPASTVTDTYDSESSGARKPAEGSPKGRGGGREQYRLISRTGPNGTVSIVYDGDGNKVRESHNGTTTAYLIDTQNLTGYAQVVEELINGNVVRTYTYGHDLLNQDQKISGTSWQATWFAYDGHGSVRQLTDGLGNVTDRYDYDAFGVLLNSAGTTFNRYRYCGEQYDDALGLYYLRARVMNASNGRFWSMDEYEGDNEDPTSLHKYLYANAEPITGIDPSGHMTATLTETVTVGALITTIAAIAVISTPQGRAMTEQGVHAGISLAGQLGSSVFGYLQQAAARVAGALTVAYESVREQIERAVEQLKKIGRQFNRFPKKFVPISKSLMPSIAAHISGVQRGIPQLLTRANATTARPNRAAAIRGLPSAGSGLSWDEYPFASTYQGGTGASVMAVPIGEQWIQGGVIGGSYIVQRITDGDRFWVVVIP
jgi:RHS repeat-associated protein